MAGTKPLALHTEYAKEGAQFQGGFYGPGNDIVFYLVRADQGSGGMETGELPETEDQWTSGFNGNGFNYDEDNLTINEKELLEGSNASFD